ncbi:hypothetical protein [Streptomyces palmae]|uniref:Uncharacterized protein n=1 Tax=Streptomyces palmae TaxID=1701085 RepID=A0A4Z0HE25_9ACTN|nr:hypothetical protein [Streptomyces palmae]TGB19385.1 hypothetical protein E4099_00720 [Streptomyces palmae]
MANRVAVHFARLLDRVLPSSGRHRAIGLAGAGAAPGAQPGTPPPPTRWKTYTQTHSPSPLRAEDCALVRPYVRSPGEGRRRLWLAVRGVDIPPRLFHPAKAAA